MIPSEDELKDIFNNFGNTIDMLYYVTACKELNDDFTKEDQENFLDHVYVMRDFLAKYKGEFPNFK